MKSTRRSFVVILLGLVAASALYIALFPLKDQHEAPSLAKEKGRSPIATMEEIYLEEFSTEGKQMELWAQRGAITPRPRRIKLVGLKLRWISDDDPQKGIFLLRGKEALYDVRAGRVYVDGGVEILTRQEYRLQTPSIVYELSTKRIRGAGPVRVDAPEGWIAARSFVADLESGKVVLREDVRTLIRPSAMGRARELLR
jgi:LPS export ABC transporter protein LptC